MKKATKFILAAFIAVAAIFTTSCALDVVAPENKWVEYEYPIEKNGTTYVTRCFAYYSNTATTIKPYGKSSIDIPAGLTIVAAPKVVGGDTTGFIDLFGEAVTANSYTIKTFKLNENVEYSADGSDTGKKSFKMSYTTWLILYNSIIHENISTGAPDIMRDGNEYSFANFKWKKLMYQMAINKLTELAAAQ